MQLITDLDNLPEPLKNGAVSIGKFDGVHYGHALIIDRLLEAARRVHGPAIAFTFDPPPIAVLHPRQMPLPLCWLERKAELLGKLGVDALIAYPTTREFLQLSAREFYDRIIRQSLSARAMVEGYNFCFGRQREGDIHLLKQFCEEDGVELKIERPVIAVGRAISSSRIRTLIMEGRIETANSMLTRPFRIRGEVVHGEHRGRDLGYPTANLKVTETILPCEGVYAGRVPLDGQVWPAAIALGPNPTFSVPVLKIEVHLLGYDGSLYGQTLEVDFLSRLRDLVRFDSVEQLLSQMRLDLDATRRVVAHADV